MNENESLAMDVKKFAEAFGVEESTAYGFLRFMAETNVVPTGKRPQPDGKKGKPATLYMLSADVGSRLGALIESKLSRLNIPATFLAAPTANDDGNGSTPAPAVA